LRITVCEQYVTLIFYFPYACAAALDFRENVKCFKRRAENLISLFFTCLHRGRTAHIYISTYTRCVFSARRVFIYFSRTKNITLPSKHVQIKIKVVLSATIYVRDLCQTCLYHPRAKHIISVRLYLYTRVYLYGMSLSQSISRLRPKYY